MTQNLQKLTSNLEEEVVRLKEQAESAERRKTIAENTAKSIEERTKKQIQNVDIEVAAYREEQLNNAKEAVDRVRSELAPLGQVKEGLQDEIDELNTRRTAVIEQNSDLESQHANLNNLVQDAQAKLVELDQDIKEAQELLRDRRGKVDSSIEEVKDLDFALQQMKQDRDALQDELERIESSIAQSRSEFESQKTYQDNELYKLEERIRKANISLKEAESKDKLIRKQWAEEKLKLDKRTEAVRRMEAQIAGAESRIEELNRFGAL